MAVIPPSSIPTLQPLWADPPCAAGSAAKRKPDPRAPQSEFKGLLGWGRGEDDDGLLDVRFERKGGSGGKGGRRR